MKLKLVIEYGLPTDEERLRKYSEMAADPTNIKRLLDEGIVSRVTAWNDNASHTIAEYEFESGEQFAKYWDDIRNHQSFSKLRPYIDNPKTRIVRPAILIPSTSEVGETVRKLIE